MEEQTLDRKDLKIQALLERISSLTANYENQDAERRVVITELNEEISNLRAQLIERDKDTSGETESPEIPSNVA